MEVGWFALDVDIPSCSLNPSTPAKYTSSQAKNGQTMVHPFNSTEVSEPEKIPTESFITPIPGIPLNIGNTQYILWQLEATARTGSVALGSLLPQLAEAVDRRLDAER